MKFSIQAFFSKCEQIRRNLVTFTEEFLYEKLHFLCSAGITLMENFIYYAVLVSEAVSFLNHFRPMFLFYTPWKHQKTSDFLMFSGGEGMEIEQ